MDLRRGLTDAEEDRLPQKLKEKAKAHFKENVDQSTRDVRGGKVTDGSKAMKRLEKKLKNRRG